MTLHEMVQTLLQMRGISKHLGQFLISLNPQKSLPCLTNRSSYFIEMIILIHNLTKHYLDIVKGFCLIKVL